MGLKDLFSKKSKSDTAGALDAPPPPPADLPDLPGADVQNQNAPQGVDPSHDTTQPELAQMQDLPPLDTTGTDLPSMPQQVSDPPTASLNTAAQPVQEQQTAQQQEDTLPNFDDLGDIPQLPDFDVPQQPTQEQQDSVLDTQQPVDDVVSPSPIEPEEQQQDQDLVMGDEALNQQDQSEQQLPSLEELEEQEGYKAQQDLAHLRNKDDLKGPLFVNVEDYRVVMHHVNYIQDDVAECEAYYEQLDHMKVVMHDSYEQFQDALLQMHRKLMLIDNILYER